MKVFLIKGQQLGLSINLLWNWDFQEQVHSKYEKFCNTICESTTFDKYIALFKIIDKVAKDMKSRDFQYRQLMFCLYTNSTLKKWQVVETDLCNLCHMAASQMVKHLFWECLKVMKIYEYVNKLFNDTLLLTAKNIFCCTVQLPVTKLANFVILLAKMYVYRCKCLNMAATPKGFHKYLDKVEELEKYNARLQNKLSKHHMKWAILYGYPEMPTNLADNIGKSLLRVDRCSLPL